MKGFELAISTMTVGERAIVTMHPDFAFGRGGKPPVIPANTWVIFDTEIVSILGKIINKYLEFPVQFSPEKIRYSMLV